MAHDKTLLKTSTAAAATITALYGWVDQVEAAGGTGTIAGIAKAHAMLKSLKKNRDRCNTLVLEPITDAIKVAQEGVDAVADLEAENRRLREALEKIIDANDSAYSLRAGDEAATKCATIARDALKGQ